MHHIRLVLLFLFISLPFSLHAAVSSGDFPDGTLWYLHADLQEMRSTGSGSKIYAWLDDEFFAEVREEVGVDLSQEVDSVTAFANNIRGAVVVIEGDLSEDLRNKLLAIAELKGNLKMLTHGKNAYYHVSDRDSPDRDNGNDIESLDDSAYFSFALEGRLLIATEEDQLKALLDNRGKIAGAGKHAGALFVLTAEKEFVQAGMQTSEFGEGEIDWDSNILRNLEQAALLIADQDGMIAVEAKLVSTDPGMAKSVASIISGLISLQVFNAEMDPQIAQVLANTKVDVVDNVLSISMVVAPDTIISIVDEH
jgi:nitrate reductase NapAB chaperone NapD